MGAYIIRRLLLMVPTILGIMLISFAIIQFAPGGPVEQIIAQITGQGGAATDRISGSGGDLNQQNSSIGGGESSSKYRGAQGLDPEFIKKLEKQFGFDKPAWERFGLMIWNYSRFEFGESYFRDISVLELIKEKMPVSISLGIWLTLISYLISIPLGIKKAVSDGSAFDIWTSGAIIIGYAVPGFLFAILLIVLFAGGSFWDIFPLRGLLSEGINSATCAPLNWVGFGQSPNIDDMSIFEKIMPYRFNGEFQPGYCSTTVIPNYFWHLALPLVSMILAAFATTTLLTKNSFLDEIKKQYVVTARAKGLNERQVLYGHVFRNAMLIVIAGFPGAFISAFFTGSLLIEAIFSLDGLGLLGFTSIINRDYPVVFATLFIFSLMGLLVSLVSDLIYTWIDPRIDFDRRDV